MCTTELGEFATRKDDFTKRNTKLIGVRVDSVESHRDWSADIAETHGQALNYPLVRDEDRHVANLDGMIHPNALATATVRTVVVIGPDKAVKLTLTYPAAVGRNVDEIIRVLDALQLSSKFSVSTPVNWKDGDDVIISPAISNEDAKEKVPPRLHHPGALPAPDSTTRQVTVLRESFPGSRRSPPKICSGGRHPPQSEDPWR